MRTTWHGFCVLSPPEPRRSRLAVPLAVHKCEFHHCTPRREACEDKRARLPCGDAVPEVQSASSTVYCAIGVLPDSEHNYDHLLRLAFGVGPWECTAGVTPAPTRTRDRRAEARNAAGRLRTRDGVVVPTNLPTCSSLCLRAKDHLRTPGGGLPEVLRPTARPVRQRSGLAATEEW